MNGFPNTAPAAKSKITQQMFKAIVPALIRRFTEDTIKTNPDSFAIYSGTNSADGGCADLISHSNSPESLAEQLTAKHLIDHGAIRSIKHLASDNIALAGITPFLERWQALGFIIRSPYDFYPFKDRGVLGIHIEAHPDFILKCGLNAGNEYDPRYFKWFLSEQSSAVIPENLRGEIIEILNNGKDPMNAAQLQLLERVKNGETLNDSEIENLIDGMYNFMSVPFAEIPKNLSKKIDDALHNDKANYKIIEYFYSCFYSKINHVAYLSQNARSLFEIMGEAKLDLTDFQGSDPLQQFGRNATKMENKWGEFIQRGILKNAAGQTIDHSGKPSDKPFIKRNFEFKNADNLFPAGIPKEMK